MHRPPSPDPRPDTLARWSLIAVLIGAFALRLHHLGTRSIWTDEGSAWTAASASLRELIRFCAIKDASPPLFYLLSSIALKFGNDEFHLRLVSAIASLALVWITYRLARLFLDRGASTVAAAITALSPYQLMFAQEARTYTLVAALTAGSIYLFFRAAVLGRARAWIPYVIVTALAIYTQSIAALGLLVQAVLAFTMPSGRRRLAAWIACLIGVLVLYLPWFFVSAAQMSHLSHSHWYVRQPSEHGVFLVFRSLMLAPIPIVSAGHGSPVPGLDAWMPRRVAHGLLTLIPLLALAAAVPSLIDRGRRGTFARIMLAAFLLPLIVVFVVSFKTPLWLPRYFVFLSPFLSVLFACGISNLRPRALAWVWAAALLAANAYACVRYDLDYTKERWRDVVRTIGAQSPVGHTAALVPFDVDPFRFYDRTLAHSIDAYEVSHPDVPFSSGWTPRQFDEMEQQASARTAGYDDVWVVVRSPNSAMRREVVARSQRVAARGRVRVGSWRWDSAMGPVWAAHYVRTDSAASAPAAR